MFYPTVRFDLHCRFTARASAAALLHLGYKRSPPKIQEEMLALFLRLCKDETPLVRKLAAQHLDRWARLLTDIPAKQKELLDAFKAFIHDDQVRVFCIGINFILLLLVLLL